METPFIKIHILGQFKRVDKFPKPKYNSIKEIPWKDTKDTKGIVGHIEIFYASQNSFSGSWALL